MLANSGVANFNRGEPYILRFCWKQAFPIQRYLDLPIGNFNFVVNCGVAIHVWREEKRGLDLLW